MSSVVYVYALRDNFKELYTVQEEKRYVGQTHDIQFRFEEEIREAQNTKKKCNCHRCNWIRKVFKNNGKIDIVILEKCTEKTINDLEIFWISELRKQGHRLTNMTEGGEGVRGWKHTEIALSKMRGRKMPKEWCEAISRRFKGRVISEEHRRNLGNSLKGKSFSKEHKRKLSEASKGKPKSKEFIEHLRKVNTGRIPKPGEYDSRKGRKQTPEFVEKRAKALKENYEIRRILQYAY